MTSEAETLAEAHVTLFQYVRNHKPARPCDLDSALLATMTLTLAMYEDSMSVKPGSSWKGFVATRKG